MKILISYSSLTGNTKTLAKGIFEYFSETAVIKSIENEIDINQYDVILHGYWVDKGGPDTKSEQFLKSIKNKKVGIFATLGAYPDSDHAKDSLLAGKDCLDDSNTLIGMYICQGAVSKAIQERMYQLPKDHFHYPNEARIKRWKDAESHPDENDISAAIEVFKHVRA